MAVEAGGFGAGFLWRRGADGYGGYVVELGDLSPGGYGEEGGGEWRVSGYIFREACQCHGGSDK